MLNYEDHIGLWRDELKDWVPDTLFDAHVHIGPEGIMEPFTEARLKEPLSTFKSLTFPDLLADYGNVYSGKKVIGLFGFGFPLYEVDMVAANSYIIDLMKREQMVKGFLLSDPKDTEWSIAEFKRALKEGVRFAGVKPYFDFLQKSNYQSTMPEFIPEGLLDFMNGEALILMLHTSGLGMGVPENQDYIKSMAERYPNIKIVLAHMGRYLEPNQCLGFLDTDVLDYPSVYLEVSSASKAEVYAKALSQKDIRKRILFGSDMPFGTISGYEYCSEETGPIFVTRDQYVWSDMSLLERPEFKANPPTYNTYHTIKAVKDGIASLGISEAEEQELKEDFFTRNALRLLE